MNERQDAGLKLFDLAGIEVRENVSVKELSIDRRTLRFSRASLILCGISIMPFFILLALLESIWKGLPFRFNASAGMDTKSNSSFMSSWSLTLAFQASLRAQ